MRKWAALLILGGIAWPAFAAKPITVGQLEDLLATLRDKPDGRVAEKLIEVNLTERVSMARLTRWEAEFPGKHTREALTELADMSAFLNPPVADVRPDPPPDRATQRRILWAGVQFAGTTMMRLPDFYATRETTHFEDTLSQQSVYSMGSIAMGSRLNSLSVQPAGVGTETAFKALHSTGSYSTTVTFRDGHEVLDEDTETHKKAEEPALGLTTDGEFGPTLVLVIRDAMQSHVSWLRWAQGASAPVAVYRYTVLKSHAHYRVGITTAGKAEALYPAYHGEFEVDPATGAILQLSVVMDFEPPHASMQAAILVDYAQVTIGDRSYICPVRGVAFSAIPILSPGAAADDPALPVQEELNDVAFTHYHQFRSDVRIVANGSGDEGTTAGGESATPAQPAATDATAEPAPVATPAGSPTAAPTPVANQAPAQAPLAATLPGTSPALTSAAEPAATLPTPPAPGAATTGISATQTVLHVNTKLVLLDVVVTEHDRPVRALDRGRFHVLEDGHEQAIESFEEHEPTASAEPAKPPALPPNTYTNLPTYPETSAINVLLLDALNTPMGDQERVRRQMIEYLSTIRPGTSLAIFTLASRLRMVEGFTADAARLTKALQNSKKSARSPVNLGLGSGDSLATTESQAAGALADSSDPETAMAVNLMLQFSADLKTYESDQRTMMTLDALSQLARYLAAIPGRKNLIWFSGSFPIGLTPEALQTSRLMNLSDYKDAVQRTKALFAAARVSVYPVDARGLMNAPTADASYIPSPSLATGGSTGFTDRGQTVAKDNTNFAVQTAQERGAIGTIADETGGRGYMNSNGLKEVVEKIVTNGSSYYTLSYVPPPEKVGKHGDEFRKIDVKVDGGKYQLAYRSGYYTEDASKPASSAGGIPTAITMATVLGAPPSTQILFQARALPAGDPELNGPASDKVTGIGPSAHSYRVDLSVDPRDLTFAEGADGARHTQLECALVAYDAEGKAANSIGRAFALNFTPEQYEQLRSSGKAISVRLGLDLPPGEDVLRIVVYDSESARTGSLEIPIRVGGK